MRQGQVVLNEPVDGQDDELAFPVGLGPVLRMFFQPEPAPASQIADTRDGSVALHGGFPLLHLQVGLPIALFLQPETVSAGVFIHLQLRG